MKWQDHITISKEVQYGKPVIKGTKIGVELIVGLLAQGLPETEVLKRYPLLDKEHLKAAFSYLHECLSEGLPFNKPTKETCIEKVCSLPVDLKTAGKSALTLAKESGFADYHRNISSTDVLDFIGKNKNLMQKWATWSEDKKNREGFYFLPDKKMVSYFSNVAGHSHEMKYETAEQACASFIILELYTILDISPEIYVMV